MWPLNCNPPCRPAQLALTGGGRDAGQTGGVGARRFPSLSVAELVAAKGDATVVVVVPARDEAATVASVVSGLVPLVKTGLVDEIVVVDDGSSDDTAARARAAGARVLSGPERGKGAALRAGLAATAGDLVVFCDADIVNFRADLVAPLLGPLLTSQSVALVKARYRRPLGDAPEGGGRVTELTARPVLRALFPELAGLSQPLAGEWASRRSVLEALPWPAGYGVEVGVLIDVGRRWGAEAVAEVDVGVRRHRNRPLTELGPMATEVLGAALARSGLGSATQDLPPLASHEARSA